MHPMDRNRIHNRSPIVPHDGTALARAVAAYDGPLPSPAVGASSDRRVHVVPVTLEQRQRDAEAAAAAAAAAEQRRVKRSRAQPSRPPRQLPDDYDLADADYVTGDDPLLDSMGHPIHVYPGRQQQEHGQTVAARAEAWAERRSRSAEELLMQAGAVLGLNAAVVASTLSALQQCLDAYPHQHCCCGAAAAGAAARQAAPSSSNANSSGAAQPQVVVGTDPRPVTYAGFGMGLYGQLQVPTYTCSWCGQHEVPPEALGCMPSAPKRGHTWYDVSAFAVSSKLHPG